MQRPGPMLRRGPRPLLLHLGLAKLPHWQESSSSWIGAWPNWSDGSPNAPRPDALLVAGIAAYRRHPWRRDLPDPPACWSEEDTRLLDYRAEVAGSPGPGHLPGHLPGGPVVLFVPSLVNRATVLDLAPGRSMLRWLARQGVRPLLLDWGWPGEAERRFGLTDYVAGRLERALLAVDGPVVLAGYCMGGLLAVAAAQRRPDRVRALALLATPWDFHAGNEGTARRVAALLPALEPALTATGTLPVDALQALFSLLDPGAVAVKYRAFAGLDPDSEAARGFVALEDWLNDGIPLAAPVAREALSRWYGANAPARGLWRVAGLPVRPETLRVPTFVAAPGQDRIVPPEGARPLAELIPGAVLHQPASGHIGMVAGRRAEAALWAPFLEWLRSLPP